MSIPARGLLLALTILILISPAVYGNRAIRSSRGTPLVSEVDGTLISGEVVKISGDGFGARDYNATLLWDDFERGSDNESLPDAPEIGNWTIVNGGPVYTNKTAHSGNLSATSYYPNGGGFRNIRYEPLSLETGAKYYQFYWFRYTSPENGTGQTKLTQVWGTEQINDYSPGIMTGGFAGDWWATYIALEDSGSYHQRNYGFTPSRGEWHTFEMLMMQSGVNESNGVVKIWIDGISVYDEDPVKTREHEGQGWLFTTFFDGMTNWDNATQTWVDDCYFSSSWARVIVGDNETLENSTHREIQIPMEWNDGEIQIRFNQGSFKVGERAYLFVVDSNNTVSEGFPIIIGESSVPEISMQSIALLASIMAIPAILIRRRGGDEV